jgi:predicted nucleotidyltransferase
MRRFFTPPSPSPLPPVGVRGALRRTADFASSLRLRLQLSDAEFFAPHSPQPPRPRRAMGSLKRTADFVSSLRLRFQLGDAEFFTPHSPQPPRPRRAMGSLRRTADFVPPSTAHSMEQRVSARHTCKRYRNYLYIRRETTKSAVRLRLPLPRRGVRGWGMGE